MQAADLCLRVHLRRSRRVLHRLARRDAADLSVHLRDLLGIRRHRINHRQRERARQIEALVGAEPRLQCEVALRREVGQRRVGAHHRAERGRDVRDVGHHRAARRELRIVGREEAVDAELVHEPAFLRVRIVVAAGHCTGMADRSRQLALPAADDAGDDRLGEVRVELVIAAGLAIQHRRLAACVVGEREGELGRGVVDVDVFAAGDHRRRAPAAHSQVLRDRRAEAAGIRQDRDRSLAQRVGRVVAAERAADANALPRIDHAQAVGAEDVDARLLAHRADLARIVHRDFLGDDENLLQLGVDADQLGHAIARGRRRQVDDAAIEAVPGLHPFAHVVVDGDVAVRRRECLAALAGRGAEDDVAARVGVAHRRHVARLAAEDVEHADAVVAGGDLRQRADADEVLEVVDALLVHEALLQTPAAGASPRRAATCARPPSRIHASACLAKSMTWLMSESKPNNRYGKPI